MEQVAWRSCGCSINGNDQSRLGWGLEVYWQVSLLMDYVVFKVPFNPMVLLSQRIMKRVAQSLGGQRHNTDVRNHLPALVGPL